MSKYDIHKNKYIPSDEEIARYKNFDKVIKKADLYDYKQATKPIYKNARVLSIVAVIIAVGLIILFESNEHEDASEELIEQSDSLTIQQKQPLKDTLTSTSTEPVNVTNDLPLNTHGANQQTIITTETSNIEAEEETSSIERIVVTNSSAEYKGGENALKQYLEKNIQYPYNAIESPYTGKIEVDLVIEKTGKISNFTIYDSPNNAISKEITRVVKMMPNWNAAVKNNSPIVSTVTVSFPFKYIGEE